MNEEAFFLDILYPTGIPRQKLKYNDLQSHLPYNLRVCHAFYNNLKTNEQAEDDVIGLETDA